MIIRARSCLAARRMQFGLLLSSQKVITKAAVVRAFRKAFSVRDAGIILFYLRGTGY